MKKLFALALALVLALSCVSALAADPVFDAFSGYLAGSGREAKLYKPTEFIETEAANMLYEDLYWFTVYGLANQNDPAITAHWASLGLEKKIYDIEDADRMWSVFVPTGHEFPEGYQFPLVFCLHGNDNDILLAETYGFAELGGREGFITVCPWAKNEDIIVEEIPRIIETLKAEEYPIDWTRVYATGFSKGGMATQNVALAFPGLFAAVAPGGCGPMGIAEDAAEIASGALNRTFQASAFENAGTLPVLFFAGSCDAMPIASTAVNAWTALAGANAPEMTEELFTNIAANSGYGVERLTGLQYQTLGQMEVRVYDGQYYYIGSYYNDDGVCTFRAVSVEGAPHWLMPSEAAVVWEFLSQFARNTETGELMYVTK